MSWAHILGYSKKTYNEKSHTAEDIVGESGLCREFCFKKFKDYVNLERSKEYGIIYNFNIEILLILLLVIHVKVEDRSPLDQIEQCVRKLKEFKVLSGG